MPDFNTERPQESTEPNRLRTLLLANRLRTLLVGGGILLIVVVAFGATLLMVPLGADPDQTEQRAAEQSEQRTAEQPLQRIGCALDSLKRSGVCVYPEIYDAGSEPTVICYASSSAAVEPGKTSCYYEDEPWPAKQEKQGGVEEAKTATAGPNTLRPGEFHADEFKPSLSFRIGEGWIQSLTESYSEVFLFELTWTRTEFPWEVLTFWNIHRAVIHKPITYKTTEQRPYPPEVMDMPKDLVGWFQHHPYLHTYNREPVTVGGFKGVQFDVVVEGIPEGRQTTCGPDCVHIFAKQIHSLRQSAIGQIYSAQSLNEGEKKRFIILEDVKGQPLCIVYGGSVTDFDEFAPEAQKVLDTVKWGGS
jgi:hypothetical protein